MLSIANVIHNENVYKSFLYKTAYSYYFLLLKIDISCTTTLNRHEINKDVFNTLLYEHIAIYMILRLKKNNLNNTIYLFFIREYKRK